MNKTDIDRVLGDLGEEYRVRDAREAAERIAREESARRAASDQRAREESAMRVKARAYLAALDPKSHTGQWFSSFAAHYATREDAALEVVRAESELERAL